MAVVRTSATSARAPFTCAPVLVLLVPTFFVCTNASSAHAPLTLAASIHSPGALQNSSLGQHTHTHTNTHTLC